MGIGTRDTTIPVLVGLLAVAALSVPGVAGQQREQLQAEPQRIARPAPTGAPTLSPGTRLLPRPEGGPARFGQKALRFPVGHCMSAAEHVVENELGLLGIRRGTTWIGGHDGRAHGYIYCVRLPATGACGGDASTAIVITSGGPGDAVESLFDRLHGAIPVRQPIDCP